MVIVTDMATKLVSHVFEGRTLEEHKDFQCGLILMLLTNFQVGITEERQMEYWKWLSLELLTPLKDADPYMYEKLLDSCQEFISFILSNKIRWNKYFWKWRQIMQFSEFLEKVDQSVFAHFALGCLEPGFRDDLLRRPEFAKSLQKDYIPRTSFDGNEPSFNQFQLFDAIREVFSNSETRELVDSNEKVWKLSPLKLEKKIEGKIPLLLKAEGGLEFRLVNYEPLATEKEIRLNFLKAIKRERFLSKVHIEKWRIILQERHLTNVEFEDFYKLIMMSPSIFFVTMTNRPFSSSIQTSILIPNSKDYYEQLIGKYDGSSSISEFATKGARAHIKELLSWHPKNGLIQCLLLSTHTAITSEICNVIDSPMEFEKMLKLLSTSEDTVSKLAVICIGLSQLPKKPQYETYLIKLIEQLRDDDPEQIESVFNKLINLFIFVDGVLASTKCLGKVPPFYRRMASFAHAAQLQRFLMTRVSNLDEFFKSVHKTSAQLYAYQTFSDLQSDPRYFPDFTAPYLLKDYFLNHIMSHSEKIKFAGFSKKLVNLISGTNDKSLSNAISLLGDYISGPIEGGEFSFDEIPNEIKELQNADFDSLELNDITCAFMNWVIKCDNADLYKYVLENLSGKLDIFDLELSDESAVIEILNNLSIIAAITKSENLAKQVRKLCYQIRSINQNLLKIEIELQFCLVASHAIENDEIRRKFVGYWITDLSFGISKDEAKKLFLGLRCLCQVEPEMWNYCSRADAALSSCLKFGQY